MLSCSSSTTKLLINKGNPELLPQDSVHAVFVLRQPADQLAEAIRADGSDAARVQAPHRVDHQRARTGLERQTRRSRRHQSRLQKDHQEV